VTRSPNPDVDLSILIVTYNSLPFVLDCLAFVDAASRDHRVEILVADNASADGSAAAVRTEWPTATVVDMGSNTGFARANNRLLSIARGRYSILLNGDAFADPGALDLLVDFLDDHPSAGIVAPRLLNADGTDQRTARSFPSPAAAIWGRRSPLTRLLPSNPWSRRYLGPTTATAAGPYVVDWVSGACLMIRTDVARRLQGLDERFFMHFEDADLCKRTRDAGLETWCVPEARVTHLEGASRRGWPAAQVRHFHYGAYRFYTKHYLTGWRTALRPIAAALLATRALLVIGIGAVPRRSAIDAEPARLIPLDVSTPRAATTREPLLGSEGGSR
jgi:N-acetylglucosaminyl-diphospho-decaprenol L-rhamnosyltransferase